LRWPVVEHKLLSFSHSEIYSLMLSDDGSGDLLNDDRAG
jgi:hypothetical protein